MADLQLIGAPPGVKSVSQLEIYLVQIKLENKLAVVLAFDDDDADMKKRELLMYLDTRQLEIVGPYKLG